MNKHAQNLRAALALYPKQIAGLFGSGKVEAAANEIDRLQALIEGSPSVTQMSTVEDHDLADVGSLFESRNHTL